MIGIGVDLVDVDRFRDSLARTPSLRDRLFRPEERAYADAHVVADAQTNARAVGLSDAGPNADALLEAPGCV